jgi:hypothetical protein
MAMMLDGLARNILVVIILSGINNNMLFIHKKNPTVYFAETTQYVDDLQRITLLRDKCSNPKEVESYNNVIHCMQEVLVFMNSINKRDRARIADTQA